MMMNNYNFIIHKYNHTEVCCCWYFKTRIHDFFWHLYDDARIFNFYVIRLTMTMRKREKNHVLERKIKIDKNAHAHKYSILSRQKIISLIYME